MYYYFGVLQCVAVCCSVLQRVAVCCSVLQCVGGGGGEQPYAATHCTRRSVPGPVERRHHGRHSMRNLQRTATHTATRCNALQHTATHCTWRSMPRGSERRHHARYSSHTLHRRTAVGGHSHRVLPPPPCDPYNDCCCIIAASIPCACVNVREGGGGEGWGKRGGAETGSETDFLNNRGHLKIAIEQD